MQSPMRSNKLTVVYAFVALLIGFWASIPTNVDRSLAQNTPQATPVSTTVSFDAETQALIARADHVIFLIPFSHWDTDWHDTFANYSQLADQNIIHAIQVAKQYPRFRYTLEQVLFVQHFWDAHPEYRADLKMLVQNRQLTFAWGGIVQPETSLVAPAIQVRNLQLGMDWITQNFGTAYVPHSAWQSDAFGNSAAFPTFLSQSSVPYLFIGRYQGKCDPDYQQCQPLPPAFYWTSPAAPKGIAGRVLTTYISYSAAWFDIYHRTDPNAQIAELRKTTDAEFNLTTSKYLFLPVGFDFADPQPNLPALVDRWNTADPHTVLVMADPESAFQYLATQPLPEISTDLNPIWQAFYDTRPAAKIADKESEYFLTAADKFSLLSGAPPSISNTLTWNTAAFDAHYDNIGGVSYDSVWENSQRPRFEQTVASAKDDLAGRIAQIATHVPAPVVIFNPTSWPRSGIMELTGNLPDTSKLPGPVQHIGTSSIAFQVNNVSPLGYIGLNGGSTTIEHPVSIVQNKNLATLANGLVSVTLDGDHGGAFSSLALISPGSTPHELLSALGDDVTYLADSGDVYGAFFGQQVARESQVTAQVTILAAGPLIARIQTVFTLGGQQVVKTVTVRADDPQVEVSLDMNALPNTTALVETPTVLDTSIRTDDLGFGAFTHPIDAKPIVPGDVTYRREIFYPIVSWSDVSTAGYGLTLITHGLQGVGGGATRTFMLVRQVTSRDEGMTDPGVHHLSYAYLPHTGTAADAQVWLTAYDFNQPLIATWHTGDQEIVQLPFDTATPARQFQALASTPTLPLSRSLFTAQSAIVSDVYRDGDQLKVIVLNYQPTVSSALQIGGQTMKLPQSVFTTIPINLPSQ